MDNSSKTITGAIITIAGFFIMSTGRGMLYYSVDGSDIIATIGGLKIGGRAIFSLGVIFIVWGIHMFSKGYGMVEKIRSRMKSISGEKKGMDKGSKMSIGAIMMVGGFFLAARGKEMHYYAFGGSDIIATIGGWTIDGRGLFFIGICIVFIGIIMFFEGYAKKEK